MHHKNKIKIESEIEYLKTELLKSQQLNQKLHRRLQKCEGAESQLAKMKYKMYKQTIRYIKFYRNQMAYWKPKLQKMRVLEDKINSLPFWVKWMIKL